MLVSILIANYNNSQFIEQCLESAVNQSYQNTEIIFCDDCSTDNSIEIIEKYKNEVLILLNEKNLGVGNTKHKLINQSKGEFFIFLDSDDFLEYDCVKNLLGEILKHDNVAMIYGQSSLLKSNTEIVLWNRSKPIITNLLNEKFNYPIFAPVLYSRLHYNLTSGINCFHRSAVDFDLWYKMEEVGKVLFLNQRLYVVRENANGVSQAFDNNKKWLGIMLEHAVFSAQAATRQNKDVRQELDEFAEVIINKLEPNLNILSLLKRVFTR